MKLIARHIKWIMLVSGVLTSTILSAVFAPSWTLTLMFGDDLVGPLSNIIVRNWGALVGLIGLMLIYGAFDSSIRRPILLLAVLSKIAFIILILLYGSQYLAKISVSIAFDLLVVILFVMYLAGGSSGRDATSKTE